ncbi:MAG: hypothetical protein KKC42_03420 [Candidatus Omnitrophica bacterium]|nr:hypothetical protein [Candidatus Omnitrophota bacterium]
MPFESNLDQEVFSKSWENDSGKIVVSVHSYNNGPNKLQMTREFKDREGKYNYAKLGRVSKEELAGILPLILEALKKM